MLQADYLKLPRFPIPLHVSDARERIATSLGTVTLYHFDEGHIGLWWHNVGQLHQAMMRTLDGLAIWNTEGKAWHVPSQYADEVLSRIRSL